MTMGECTFLHFLTLSLSHWRVIYTVTLGPFRSVLKGIIGQWKQEGEVFQAASILNPTLRHNSYQSPVYRQGGQVEERRRAVKRITERDKHSGRMEIEPTMKHRIGNMELKHREGGDESSKGRKGVYFRKLGSCTKEKHIVTVRCICKANTDIHVLGKM